MATQKNRFEPFKTALLFTVFNNLKMCAFPYIRLRTHSNWGTPKVYETKCKSRSMIWWSEIWKYLFAFCFPSWSVRTHATIFSRFKVAYPQIFIFFCFHQRNGNQIGNFRKMLWEHAFAIMFWETQILLVWLSLCLWSWYNDFPCDSEMWSSLFGALRIIDHSPTLYTQRNTEQNRSEPQSAHIEDEKEPSSAMLIPSSEK